MESCNFLTLVGRLVVYFIVYVSFYIGTTVTVDLCTVQNTVCQNFLVFFF